MRDISEIIDIGIIGFFCIWLAVTIIAQIWGNFLKFDYLELIPICRFFAPSPVSTDICVYAQGLDLKGSELTEWRQLYRSDKNWLSFAWNPSHRIWKAYYDLVNEIELVRKADKVWHLTCPYLILLNASGALFKNHPDVKMVKFIVTSHPGFEDCTRDIIFKSHEHRLC